MNLKGRERKSQGYKLKYYPGFRLVEETDEILQNLSMASYKYTSQKQGPAHYNSTFGKITTVLSRGSRKFLTAEQTKPHYVQKQQIKIATV